MSRSGSEAERELSSGLVTDTAGRARAGSRMFGVSTRARWSAKRGRNCLPEQRCKHTMESPSRRGACCNMTLPITQRDDDDPTSSPIVPPASPPAQPPPPALPQAAEPVQLLLGLELSNVRYRCLRRGIEYSISDSKERLIRQLLRDMDGGHRRVRHHVISASARGNVIRLRALLAQGADPNETNEHGTTALMEGCVHGRVACVRILLEHDANVDAVTMTGQTALMRACRFGVLPVVQLLCAYGASREAKDADGWSVADHARGRSGRWSQASWQGREPGPGQTECLVWLHRTFDYEPLHLIEHLTPEQVGKQLHAGVDVHALATRRAGRFSPLERAQELLRASDGADGPGGSPHEAARLLVALARPDAWEAAWLAQHARTLALRMKRRAAELLQLVQLGCVGSAERGSRGHALQDVWSAMIVPMILRAEYGFDPGRASRRPAPGFSFKRAHDGSDCSVAVAVQRAMWVMDPRATARCDVRAIVTAIEHGLGVRDVATLRALLRRSALTGLAEPSSPDMAGFMAVKSIIGEAAPLSFVAVLKAVVNGRYDDDTSLEKQPH